jgi:hypothetical protein
VDFCGKPSIGVGEHRVALCDKGNLFHLPVRLPDERWSASCREQLGHQAMSVIRVIDPVTMKNDQWNFFEYVLLCFRQLAGVVVSTPRS